MAARRCASTSRHGPRAFPRALLALGIAALVLVEAGGAAAQEPASAAVERALELLGGALAGGPLETEATLTEALRLVRAEHGDYDPLLARLEARIAEPATPLGLVLAYARACVRAGDLERALPVLEAQAEAGRLDAAGLAERARVLELLGRRDDAITALGAALERAEGPALAIALNVRQASLLLERPATRERGLAALRKVMALDPRNLDLAWYVGYLGALRGAPEILLDLSAREADPAVAFRDHLLLGTWSLRAERFDAAREHFERAAAVGPLGRDRRFAQERLIATHRAQGTLEELCARWLAAEERGPERLDALVALLRELRRPEDALELLMKDRDGGAVTSRSLQREIIGLALECGRQEEVEATYQALVKREPRKASWRSGLALLYVLQGRRDAALAVFVDGVAASDSGRDCMRLAQAARDLALVEAAETAARKAQGFEEKERVQARLFLADLARERGLTDEALASLATVEKDFPDNDAALLQVADAYERYGRPQEAIRMLEIVSERTGGEDLLMRLAWLVEGQEKVEESLGIWKRLWRVTALPARRRQAEDRLLDLASKSGTLADLAIELERELDAGGGSIEGLSLLVKLYSRAGDPISAVEILREHGPRLQGDAVAIRKTMAHVYQQCDSYRRYEETLKELQELDPENAIDYQQQIAIGALERGKGRQAKRVLGELQALSKGDVSAEEFSAGVLAMVELHDEAARAYGRVLARHPDRIEGNLLWANSMQKLGEGQRAIRSFLDLLDRAEKDDLFTVAVDGLLNLQAGGEALRIALRRIHERIAARPAKAFLYQLAADVHEELGEREKQVLTTELMTIVGGERRPSLLRELMDLESLRGRPAGLIDYGRSLMALGQEMPPQVYLDLGEALIKTGDLVNAERVFARARGEGDFVQIQERVAGYYEKAGLVSDAERLLRQALLARPQDVALLYRVGTLAEIGGHREQARRDYETAMDLLIRRAPPYVGEEDSEKEEEPKPGGAGGATARVFTSGGVVLRSFSTRRWSRNVDEYSRIGAQVARALIEAVPPGGPQLLALLGRRIEEEVGLLESEKAFRAKLADNPRLQRLLGFARDAALSLGGLDRADLWDRDVLGHYAEDRDAQRSAISARRSRGLRIRAEALKEALGYDEKAKEKEKEKESAAPALWRRRCIEDPESLRALLDAGPVEPRVAAAVTRELWMSGRRDLAAEVVDAADPAAPGTPVATASALTRAAMMLDDSAQVKTWALRWLEIAAREKSSGRAAGGIGAVFDACWKVLDEEAREGLWQRLVEIEEQAEEERRWVLARARSVAGRRIGREVKLDFEILDAWAEKDVKYLGRAEEVLLCAEPEDRAPLLTKIIERMPRTYPTHFTSFVMDFPEEIDEGMADELVRGLRASLDGQRQQTHNYRYPAWRLAKSDRVGLPVVQRMLDLLFEEFPGDETVALSVAWTRLQAGDEEGARELLAKMLPRAFKTSEPDYYLTDLIQGFATRGDKKSRAAVLDVVSEIERTGSTPALVLFRNRLLQAEQSHRESAALLAKAFVEHPDDEQIRQAYTNTLRVQGRLAEVLRLQREWLEAKPAESPWLYGQIARSYVQIHQPLAALEMLQKAPGEVNALPLEMELNERLGREDAVCQVFRRFAVLRRGRYFYGNTEWPAPSSGGGLGPVIEARERAAAGPKEEAQPGPYLWGSRLDRSLFWHVADKPWGAEEIARLLRSQSTGSLNRADALVMAAIRGRVAAEPRTELVKQLAERIGAGDLPPRDGLLLLFLARESEEGVPAELVPGLDLILRQAMETGSPSPALLRELTWLFVKAGRPERARPLMDWLIEETLLGDNVGQLDGLLKSYVDLNVLAYPEEARKERCAAVYRRIDAGPLAKAPKRFAVETIRLKRFAELEDEVEIARSLERIGVLAGELDPLERNGWERHWRPVLRFHADRGDLDAFASALERFIGILQQDPKWDAATLNISTLLPSAAKATDPSQLVRRVKDLVEPLIPEARRKGLARVLATWLVRAGEDAAALVLYRPYVGERGVQLSERLFVADLARLGGDADLAHEIECALLREHALPIARAPRLLDEVARRDGESAARAAALDLATDTDDPAVLRRATLAEIDASHLKEARALLERWEANAPADPALDPVRKLLP